LEFFLKFLIYIVILICVFVSIRFFTYIEEKILCVFHICKGPSYVGFIGFLQPFSYALGLLFRIILTSKNTNLIIFSFSPFVSLILSILFWTCLPFLNISVVLNKSILFFLVIIGFSVFPILILRWSSNNKYRRIGRLRRVAQIVSYELCLRFFILGIIYFLKGLGFKIFVLNMIVSGIFILLPLFNLVFIFLLAESNRRPFDFSESPSELVRGFITEYRGRGFVVLFIAEYLTIIFISVLFLIFFFFFYYLLIGIRVSLIGFLYIWIRGTMIRFRYDIIIDLNWKYFLPKIMYIYIYIVGVRIYFL